MFQLYRSNYKNADSIVMYTRIPNTGTITTKSESIQVVFSSRCATKSKEACLTFYENEEAYRSNPSNHLKKFWGPPSNFIDTTFVNRSSLYFRFETPERDSRKIAIMALSGEGSARIDLNNTVTITQRSSFPTICASLEDVCLSTGKWYYEILIVEAGLAQFGWGDRDFEPSSESGDGTGDDEHSWAYDGHRTSKWHDGSTTWGKSWSSGQVVGCAVDLDNRKMYVVFERVAREFR